MAKAFWSVHSAPQPLVSRLWAAWAGGRARGWLGYAVARGCPPPRCATKCWAGLRERGVGADLGA